MMPPPTASRLVRFATFELDLKSGEVRRNGQRIRLQEQPLQVLTMLVEHAGDVVTREELRGRLWPDDTFVDFDQGLNKALNKVRRALGDSAELPRYIETLPKRGYRFIVPVEYEGPGLAPAQPGHPQNSQNGQQLPAPAPAVEGVLPQALPKLRISPSAIARQVVPLMVEAVLDNYRSRMCWRRVAVWVAAVGLVALLMTLIRLGK